MSRKAGEPTEERVEVEVESERFVPERDGPDLAYEHLHRYAIAADALAGLKVLDLGSGSGYGTALLANTAHSVVGIDRTPARGSRVVRGDAQALAFADGSFDAVVCFEAIEHFEQPERCLEEITRVLKDPGILLLSTPNRELYSERARHRNPHHLHEFSPSELKERLDALFPIVRLFGQSLWAGSWVAPIDARDSRHREIEVLRDPEAGFAGRRSRAPWTSPDEPEAPAPLYLLAACGKGSSAHNRIGALGESLLHDPVQWFLGRYLEGLQEAENNRAEIVRASQSAHAFEEERERARARVAALEAELVEVLRVHERETLRLKRELSLSKGATTQLESEIEAARRSASILETELAEARSRIDSLVSEVREKTQALDADAREQSEALVAAHAQIESACAESSLLREGHADLEAQIERARESFRDLELQIEKARSVNEELVLKNATLAERLKLSEAARVEGERTLNDLEQRAEAMRKKLEGRFIRILMWVDRWTSKPTV